MTYNDNNVGFLTGAMRLFALAATCLLVHGVWASEITWAKGVGGDMQVGANWGGGNVPTSSDAIKINKDQSAPIWLSEDLTATGGYSYFNANFELALTNDTGVAKTLTFSTIHAGSNSKTITQTAGRLSFTCFYMGDAGSSYTNDTFIIDGANTEFAGGTLNVGTKEANNTFIAKNGATVSGSALNVGRNQMKETEPSTNNCFRVEGAGTTATFSGAVQFGANGLCNIEVLDGGCLMVTNLYVRRNTSNSTYATIPWYGGHSMLVSGEGSKVVVNGSTGGVMLGDYNAPDCSVVVENGAIWESHGEFKMCWNDYVTNATFRLTSGATFTHDVHNLQVGAKSTGTNLLFEVDDAMATVTGSVYVKGFDSSIRIVNGASMTATGDIGVGSGVGTNATLFVSGSSTKVGVENTLRIFPGGTLAVEIPKAGFTGSEPPITCKTLTFDAGSSLVVTLEKANHPGGRVVLARATNNITTLGNLSVTLPEGVTLDTSNAKELAVNVPTSGLTIIFK